MSEDIAAGEPSQAPTPKRNWEVWGVWFGVALFFWLVIFVRGWLVIRFLTPPGSLTFPTSSGYWVALEAWDFVQDIALLPLLAYFVQWKVKSFDLTGIFVMTLAAGLLVEIVPMTIARVCTTNASPPCSYQFDVGMWGQLSSIVPALSDALNRSLIMVAGAFLSLWRRGAITVTRPGRSKSLFLAAWLAVGFLAVGAMSIANASTNIIFGDWYHGLVDLLSGPLLAVCLGYFLHARLRQVGIKELFSMVALGGMLAYAITQAAYGITIAQVTTVVRATIVVGVFSAWIVLSGCLLSVFEKKSNIALEWLTKIFVPVGGPGISKFEHDTISSGCIVSVSANVLAEFVTLYGIWRGLVHESNPLEVWTFASTFNFFISTVLHVLLIVTPFLLANFFVHRFEKRRRRRGKSKPRNPNTTADFLLIIALWLVIGLTSIDCVRDIVTVLL
jgi:hypothetical protein